MKGVELSSLSGELTKVSSKHQLNPALSIQNIESKFPPDELEYLQGRYGDEIFSRFVVDRAYGNFHMRFFTRFSFDELCKFCCSGYIHSSVSQFFEEHPPYQVLYKIQNSVWRWSVRGIKWNDLVDTYRCLGSFKLTDNPDFEVRLDYTTGWNEYGYSEHSRVYLDGVFGYLVYYKKKHVMTIGFSVLKNRGILIQQVQLVKKTGNRWLYQLPKNRLEFILERFHTHFPEHILYVINGSDLFEKIRLDYKSALESAIRTNDSVARELFEERIAHLAAGKFRIVSLYENIGRFTWAGRSKKAHGLRYRRVTL